MPWFLGNSYQYRHMWDTNFFWFPAFVVPLAVWSVIWTGLALWYAAKRDNKGWFIFFLFVHTAGIVEIIYLLFIAHAFAPRRGTPKKRT